MTDSTSSEETLLQFPCDFPIKVMGKMHDEFAQTITQVVLDHFPDYNPATMEMRASQANNYLSVTITVRADNKAQLDNLYRELTAHPMVRLVL
jgi:Uncharacterized conserved protein